jgi:hypothetical protein
MFKAQPRQAVAELPSVRNSCPRIVAEHVEVQHLPAEDAEPSAACDPTGLHRQPTGCADVGSAAEETLRRQDQSRLCRYETICRYLAVDTNISKWSAS